MSDYMADLSGLRDLGGIGGNTTPKLKNGGAGKSQLDMNDYLNLMVAMFQNQSMDNTADVSDMMNNMVQMSVVEAISSISSLIQESTALNYAASLVGKQVTVGIVNNGQLLEIEGYVAATGTYNGQQVLFLKDKNGNPIEGYVPITSIMAIGWLSQTGAAGGTEGPKEPESPEEPEIPEIPEIPEDPEDPGDIGDPEDPEIPGGVEGPGESGESGEIGGNEEPEAPEVSGGTGGTETPETPEVPEESGGAGAAGQTGENDETEIPEGTDRVEEAAAAEQA